MQAVDEIVKNGLLEAMDEFHRVCEENGLKYYLIGGSLIGAIRHKGCIPWDDDFDIIMFKEDFDKLLLLKNKFKENLKLRHRALLETPMLPIARIENINIAIDEGYYSGVKTSVFVDVFCFNETFTAKALQKFHFKIVGFSRLLLRLKERTYSKIKYSKSALYLLNIVSVLFSILPKTFFNYVLSLSENMCSIAGKKEYVANFHGCWKTKEIAPRKLFEKRKLYDFEGRQYWSIEDADAWLRPI